MLQLLPVGMPPQTLSLIVTHNSLSVGDEIIGGARCLSEHVCIVKFCVHIHRCDVIVICHLTNVVMLDVNVFRALVVDWILG